MKVIAVYGSIRKESQSARVLEEVVKGAKDAGHEVKTYCIPAMKLQGCIACGQCQKKECDCVMEDGLKEYWKDLHECRALLLSAPNYMGQVSGQMISFMNRHYCMSNHQVSRLRNKVKLVGIFSQGTPAKLGIYDSVYDWYLKTFAALGMELEQKIVVGSGSDLSEGTDICKQAYQLGKKL